VSVIRDSYRDCSLAPASEHLATPLQITFGSERIIDVTHVICTAHRILSDLITLTMLEQGYKLFNFLQSVGRSQCFARRPKSYVLAQLALQLLCISCQTTYNHVDTNIFFLPKLKFRDF
jgi:hypothetical protein